MYFLSFIGSSDDCVRVSWACCDWSVLLFQRICVCQIINLTTRYMLFRKLYMQLWHQCCEMLMSLDYLLSRKDPTGGEHLNLAWWFVLPSDPIRTFCYVSFNRSINNSYMASTNVFSKHIQRWVVSPGLLDMCLNFYTTIVAEKSKKV